MSRATNWLVKKRDEDLYLIISPRPTAANHWTPHPVKATRFCDAEFAFSNARTNGGEAVICDLLPEEEEE